jgi:hypothetical protein
MTPSGDERMDRVSQAARVASDAITLLPDIEPIMREEREDLRIGALAELHRNAHVGGDTLRPALIIRLCDQADRLEAELGEIVHGCDVPGHPTIYTHRHLEGEVALRWLIAKLNAERDALRQAILDIDAHATPYGDIPDEPGWIGTYLVTAGALHRALGKIGHSAPACDAEAERNELRAGRHALNEVIADCHRRLSRRVEQVGKLTEALITAHTFITTTGFGGSPMAERMAAVLREQEAQE